MCLARHRWHLWWPSDCCAAWFNFHRRCLARQSKLLPSRAPPTPVTSLWISRFAILGKSGEVSSFLPLSVRLCCLHSAPSHCSKSLRLFFLLVCCLPLRSSLLLIFCGAYFELRSLFNMKTSNSVSFFLSATLRSNHSATVITSSPPTCCHTPLKKHVLGAPKASSPFNNACATSR